METKFCKFCQCDHPLTDEWWFFRSQNRVLCKTHERATTKTYHANHDSKQRYADKNREAMNLRTTEWRLKNKEKVREYDRKYYKTVKSNDPMYALRSILRIRMCKAIRNNQKAGSAVRDLGCTIPELKQYLESKFQEGMTWDNWSLHGWHIDHIIPLSSFDLTDREQFLRACHYTNLQPLWAEENLRKSNKLEESPQRCYADCGL